MFAILESDLTRIYSEVQELPIPFNNTFEVFDRLSAPHTDRLSHTKNGSAKDGIPCFWNIPPVADC